jgi:CubicO group peptidase (beta-lactamase class C family)
MKLSVAIIILLLFCQSGCINGSTPSGQTADKHGEFYRDTRQFMKDNRVKGLSIALFDSDSIYWQQSFGKSTYGYRINDSTMFSLQSISKNLTSLGVMLAVEEGLLELDTPVARYLRYFSVNSCFQENPQEVITLRMLLSNTAGFPHEAPVGNNFDSSFPSIGAHIESIGDSWLRFPAGTNYSYSNLGFDLAATIIETVSGLPFDEYLSSRLFSPLGMPHSTVNGSVFINSDNKTEGQIYHVKTRHYPIPLIGSGATYSSLNDMVRYVKMHLNFGMVDGERLISGQSLLEMHRINFSNYGLGTYIDTLFGSWYLNHNGGGFGYSSSIVWFPEYNIGCVVLANRMVNCFALAAAVISRHLGISNPGRDRDVLRTNGFSPFADPVIRTNAPVQATCEGETVFREEWEKYIGAYEVVLGGFEYKRYARLAFALGMRPVTIKVARVDDEMWIFTNWADVSRLYEYRPGLFFTGSGRALDLRGENPTFDNLRIERY